MPISRLEYENMRQRTERARHSPEQSVKDEVAELHEPIIRWCKQVGVPYQYTRPDKKTRGVVGAPDFFIAWCGAIYAIECKAEGGELSPAQNVWMRQAKDHRVEVYVISTMREFYALVGL